jgi:phage host-nuclease inhibitor protein Gam
MPRKPSKKKEPLPFIVLASEEALSAALDRYQAVALDLAAKKIALEKAVAALKAAAAAEAAPLAAELLQLEGSIGLFCTNHKADLFTDPKSREYPNATVGFRLSPPSVGHILSDDTDAAIALRLESLPWGEGYVTYKGPTLDKEALLRDRAQFTDAQLAEAGIRFEQPERFFIDLKSDSAQGVSKPAEAAAA